MHSQTLTDDQRKMSTRTVRILTERICLIWMDSCKFVFRLTTTPTVDGEASFFMPILFVPSLRGRIPERGLFTRKSGRGGRFGRKERTDRQTDRQNGCGTSTSIEAAFSRSRRKIASRKSNPWWSERVRKRNEKRGDERAWTQRETVDVVGQKSFSSVSPREKISDSHMCVVGSEKKPMEALQASTEKDKGKRERGEKSVHTDRRKEKEREKGGI